TPTLHWVLGPGEGTPSVELCKDRACTMPLSITTVMAEDHLSAVPAAPLPLGWVYWRVHVALGGQESVSPTWQVLVGRPTTATTPDIDSSSGMIFDVNGDGYADLLVGAPAARTPTQPGGVVHVYLGSATPSASAWNGATAEQRIDIVLPADVKQ